MADILYNYGQIDQAVADMRAGVNSLNTKLEDMDSELKQLQSSWDGQAKRAYDASKAKWTEGMAPAFVAGTHVLPAAKDTVRDAEIPARASDAATDTPSSKESRSHDERDVSSTMRW